MAEAKHSHEQQRRRGQRRSERVWKGARRAASRSRGAVRTIACSEMPVVEQSKFASVTRSFMASVIFLIVEVAPDRARTEHWVAE